MVLCPTFGITVLPDFLVSRTDVNLIVFLSVVFTRRLLPCCRFCHADCVLFLPSLMEAYKGFKPGQADVVFVSSDRSEALQRKNMEEG